MNLHDSLKSLLVAWVQAWPVELAATVVAEQNNESFMHELVDITLSDYYGQVTGDPPNANRAKEALKQKPATRSALRRTIVSLAGERVAQCRHRSAYYSMEHDNFYCMVCRRGMGQPFYDECIGRVEDFPTAPNEIQSPKEV